jgi:hypothetical protein
LLNADVSGEMLVNILVVQVQSTLLGASIKAKELKNQNGVFHILIAGFNEFLNDNAKWGIQVLRHLLSKSFGAQEVGLHLKDPQAVVEHMPVLVDGLLSLVQAWRAEFAHDLHDFRSAFDYCSCLSRS